MAGTLHKQSTSPRLAVFLALVIGLPSLASPQLDQARKLMHEERLREAVELLEETAEENTGIRKAQALNAKGWVLYRDGRIVDATRSYREALAIARREDNATLEVRVLNNLGINYFASGDLENAKSVFGESQELGSMLASRYLEMIARLEKSARVRSLISQGVEHRLNRDFEQAADEYTKALEIDPHNNDALAYRGYAYFRLSEYRLALADLERALQDNSDRLDVIINFMKVNCASGLGPDVDSLLASHRAVVEDKKEEILGDMELHRVCNNQIRIE